MNHSIHSADRATHLKIVVVALVAAIGVAAFGEYHPRYPNDTPQHRASNRRIEISVLRYE